MNRSMQPRARSVGQTPSFWWDFNGPESDVIVQSDWPGGQELARFKAPAGQESREPEIEMAQALIADFRAGRKTPPWSKDNRGKA